MKDVRTEALATSKATAAARCFFSLGDGTAPGGTVCVYLLSCERRVSSYPAPHGPSATRTGSTPAGPSSWPGSYAADSSGYSKKPAPGCAAARSSRLLFLPCQVRPACSRQRVQKLKPALQPHFQLHGSSGCRLRCWVPGHYMLA